MVRLIVILSFLSLAGMILIDRALGPRAEFLNAWSVVERLLGRVPAAGESWVAQRAGSVGELLMVVLVNAAVGAVLAGLARLGQRLLV